MWAELVALLRLAAWDLLLLAIGAAWGVLIAEVWIGGRRLRAARGEPKDGKAKE